ncbi:MAG: exodeoxyribonuclease VII large subunit [Firmicutes bacterium]|nr:exodeoxyribonuclease VII large subunit [Bacillota bacterium]
MPVFSVTEVTQRIQELLESDPVLGALWVRGEISNMSVSAQGHLYFTLKDQTAQLRAVMFRSRTQALSFLPENGMTVIVRGRVSLYERDGKVQLYVYEMEADGAGLHSILLQELKARLEKEGLFDPSRKRVLPKFPKRVGVATSLEGAAIRDIVEIIRHRWPLCDIVIAPCAVQGEEAPLQITAALDLFNRYGKVDVIIVGRGGGSFEELSAFNNESVVRSIFGSRIPVISAVGHERDTTLADLAADARAATPSAAAAAVVPDQREVFGQLQQIAERLRLGISRRIELLRIRLHNASQSRFFVRPWETIFSRSVQNLDHLAGRLELAVRDKVQKAEKELAVLNARLAVLNPLETLSRGYCICRRAATGEVVTDAAQVSLGETVVIVLRKGQLSCKVEGSI